MTEPIFLHRKPRVYIAGPYTLGDVAVNIRAAVQVAEEIIRAGGVPYLPHTTHLWHLISPHDHAYWLALDLEWLRTCDCLLRLPGESRGADIEEAEARRAGLPVLTGKFAVQHLAGWYARCLSDAAATEEQVAAENL